MAVEAYSAASLESQPELKPGPKPMISPDLPSQDSTLPERHTDGTPDLGALVSYLEYDPQPSIVLDPNYQILAANTAYQRQFGVKGQAHVGRKCYQVSHHYDVPCDQAGEHCPMRRAAEVRSADRVLHIHHTPRGPEHVDVELRPIFDANAEIVAYVERLATVRGASAKPSAAGLVGRAPAFNKAISALQRVAPSMLPVLLLGESGTGKELFAQALHEASERAQRPFVVVDCSGITETLFESELFGFEKGAFTGATGRKQGLVETAQGGTLFLDEIGDMPYPLQVRLLRVLQERVVNPLGSTKSIPVDIAIICATHRDLREMIAQNRFREDLYYRLNGLVVRLPPLRERSDLSVVIQKLLQRESHGCASRPLSVAPDVMALFERCAWPGNFRQLGNLLRTAAAMVDEDGEIRREHLPDDFFDDLRCRTEARRLPDAPEASAASAASSGTESFAMEDARLVDVTASMIAATLARHGGNVSAAARALGVSRNTIYRKMPAADSSRGSGDA